MNYRIALPPDIPQIQRVRHSVRENILSDPSKVTDEDVHDFITRRGRGWVCEVGGHIVGFSIADLEEDNVWALFVEPQYAGQGIGKELHRLMLDWYFGPEPEGAGKEKIWLSTDPATRAEEFYRRAGWTEAGTEGNGEIRFEMRREEWG